MVLSLKLQTTLSTLMSEGPSDKGKPRVGERKRRLKQVLLRSLHPRSSLHSTFRCHGHHSLDQSDDHPNIRTMQPTFGSMFHPSTPPTFLLHHLMLSRSRFYQRNLPVIQVHNLVQSYTAYCTMELHPVKMMHLAEEE